MTEKIGRYLVRGEIGKGGFGAVYRAWDPVMRRDVAIKVLTSVNDPGMLARFLSEPATTGILKHKNIITVHDFGEHESAPYLVMELIDGRSLREAIDAGPPLPLAEKVGILGEVARGLWHAHQSGVIHRDVKPANIMLLAGGGVKVLDFGIARMVNPNLTRQTSTGMMVGTPEYMAPEQFEDEDATPLSDIFAYGVVCYELLSGQQPFRARNLASVVNLITTKVPELLRTLVPDCPEALESIVQQAMAKRPSERYQSLQELLFDLAPIEAGFRKERVDAMAAEAQRSLEAGELESAQKLVWQALELDPNHPPSQELRRRIQRLRERPALEERWKAAVSEAESLLPRNAFEEAIQALEAMRGWLGAESVADLRLDVEARIAVAKEARERARRIETLLAEAQEAAGRHDLAAVSLTVAQALSLDSGNARALAFEQWVAEESERARVEAEKAERERLRREELAKVRQVVQEQVAALCFEEAWRSIEVALRRYPGDPDLVGLQAWVEQAFQTKRRQAAEALRAEEERPAASVPMVESIPREEKAAVLERRVEKAAADMVVQRPDLAEGSSEEPIKDRGTQAEPPAPPMQDLNLRGWILSGARGMLLVVVVASGIWWWRHSAGTTAPPSGGTPFASPAAPSAAFDPNKGAVGAHPAPLLPDPPAVRGPAPGSSRLPPLLSGTSVPVAPSTNAVVEPTLRAGATKVNSKDELTYCWIPTGTFKKGCSPGDDECEPDEKPAHKVTISKGFWMGQTEVTQEAWQKVMGTVSPSLFRGNKPPVENIAWTQAKSFCQAGVMRLPTEAEWEYAARAGTTGSRYGNLKGIAWDGSNSGNMTHDVGGKQANNWGLQDMLGNVWEWVADWYAGKYPKGDAIDPRGPANGTLKSLRGGSWADSTLGTRVSSHMGLGPADHTITVGFRCAGN